MSVHFDLVFFSLFFNWNIMKDFMKLLMLLAEDTDSSVRMNVAPVIVEIAKLAPNRDQVSGLLNKTYKASTSTFENT